MKELLKDWNTIPNWLSYLRIVLVPVFAVLFLKGYIGWALIVLAISGLSDFFDGKIARKYNQVSELGKIIDPVADKLTQITIAVLFYIYFKNSSVDLIKSFSWVFLIFVIKELVMVVFGGLMLLLNMRPGAAEIWGKAATMVFYIVMIIIVLFGPEIGFLKSIFVLPDIVLLILVIISVLMTVTAFLGYLPRTFKMFKEKYKKG